MARNWKERAILSAVGGAMWALCPPASAQTYDDVADRVGNTSCQGFDDWLDRLLYNRNDVTNWAGIGTLPVEKKFVPDNQRAGMVTKRIVMFGDMAGMEKDRTPLVHPDVQRIFEGADLVIGNVEAPFDTRAPFPATTGSYSSQWFNFHVSPGYVKSFLNQHCINPAKTVLTVANNHADDASRFQYTMNVACPSTETSWYGGTTCKPAAAVDNVQFVGVDLATYTTPAIRSIDLGSGLKVGVVAWTHVQNNRPDRDLLGFTKSPTWEGSLELSGRDFTYRKNALGVKFLIGMPHWDCQFNDYPHPQTVAAATSFANAGFDLIAGAHPSVLQPANMVGTSHSALAFYSLGGLGSALVPPNPVNTMTVVEMVVNTAGTLLEYKLHMLVERPVPFDTTTLPGSPTGAGSVTCPGGTPIKDIPRNTDREIVTFLKAWNDATLSGNQTALDKLLKAARHVDTLFK